MYIQGMMKDLYLLMQKLDGLQSMNLKNMLKIVMMLSGYIRMEMVEKNTFQ